MSFFTPIRMLVIGAIFVLAGVVLPLLMVVKVLESTLFLNFFSYVIGLVGTFLGIAGASMYVNRGLGTLHLPVRLFARPEIALLTIRSA